MVAGVHVGIGITIIIIGKLRMPQSIPRNINKTCTADRQNRYFAHLSCSTTFNAFMLYYSVLQYDTKEQVRYYAKGTISVLPPRNSCDTGTSATWHILAQ